MKIALATYELQKVVYIDILFKVTNIKFCFLPTLASFLITVNHRREKFKKKIIINIKNANNNDDDYKHNTFYKTIRLDFFYFSAMTWENIYSDMHILILLLL